MYSQDKVIRVQFDTPYIKGLPTTIHTSATVDGVYRETMDRKTYEDSYTQEMRVLYDLVTHGTPVKTTIDDAAEDIQIFQMMMQVGSACKGVD